MTAKLKKSTKRLITLAVVIIIAVSVFFIYVSDYYKADERAKAVLAGEDITVYEDMILLSPEEKSDNAIIFYPGAKVEYTAYLPILEKLKDEGVTCLLLKMPFNMAIFDVNRADKAYEKLEGIENIYIAGHSMGGAMASKYAEDNADKLKGVILLGAYIYGEYPPQKTLTIYGSYNDEVEEKIDYTENIFVIEGGNHAKFGNYGPQKGDEDGDITSEEQQDKAVEIIMDFI